MPWRGVSGVAVEVPDGWEWFAGSGTIYAHSPDGRGGFFFTIGVIGHKDAVAGLVSEGPAIREAMKLVSYRNVGPLRDMSALQVVHFDPPVHGKVEGRATLSSSGVASDGTRQIAVAFAIAHAVLPSLDPNVYGYYERGQATEVVACSLDGEQAALHLAITAAGSYLRAPPR